MLLAEEEDKLLRGISYIELNVFGGNDVARNLYRSLGSAGRRPGRCGRNSPSADTCTSLLLVFWLQVSATTRPRNTSGGAKNPPEPLVQHLHDVEPDV